jgi:hypothetical protein
LLTTESLIEDFIAEYRRSRIVAETTVRAVLKRALEYEAVYKKHFFDFTEREILSMFTDAHVISHMSLQNWNNILKHASRWITFRMSGQATNNAYEFITKDKVKQCLDVDKKDRTMLLREDVTTLQEDLLNWTDKAIIELLFLGVGGKWLRELCYLDPSQVSQQDMKIYFRNGKVIPIDHRCYNILQAAFNEEEMMSYAEEPKISFVKSVGIYKMRANTLYTNDDAKNEVDAERRYRWIQRRLTIIREYSGIPMTSGTIQNSGLLHYLRMGVHKTGMSFREYVYSEEGKQLAMRYDILSEYAAITLIEKFKQYFEE